MGTATGRRRAAPVYHATKPCAGLKVPIMRVLSRIEAKTAATTVPFGRRTHRQRRNIPRQRRACGGASAIASLLPRAVGPRLMMRNDPSELCIDRLIDDQASPRVNRNSPFATSATTPPGKTCFAAKPPDVASSLSSSHLSMPIACIGQPHRRQTVASSSRTRNRGRAASESISMRTSPDRSIATQ